MRRNFFFSEPQAGANPTFPLIARPPAFDIAAHDTNGVENGFNRVGGAKRFAQWHGNVELVQREGFSSTEFVNDFETPARINSCCCCSLAARSGGGLIHTAAGRAGGRGCTRTKRSGFLGKAWLRTTWRWATTSSARRSWSASGVSRPMPLWWCSALYQGKKLWQKARAS